MKVYAVITGDISNFTSLGDGYRQALIEDTKSLLQTWVALPQNSAVFRGDSYQVLFEEPDNVITRAIQLICWFRKYSGNKKKEKLSTRLSIGIGGIAFTGTSVLDSDGEAFHLSGRNFEKMQPGEMIRITTADNKKNDLFRVILMLINLIMDEWTQNQAETIFWLLEDQTTTQQEVAKKLNIFQSGIAKRLKLAHWREIEKAIKYLSNEIITSK